MRRTFCARCHAVGLARCVHPTRASGPGGKHRARETYRMHPAKTFVNVPTSPFSLLNVTEVATDALAESFAPVPSNKAPSGQDSEDFTTLMQELWAAPSELTGELPEPLEAPKKAPAATLRRSLIVTPIVLLVVGLIGWQTYQPWAAGTGIDGISADAIRDVNTELRALPSTIDEILEDGTPGAQLSEAATSLTRWSAQVSLLMSAGLTTDTDGTNPAPALFEAAGSEARALQTLLSDALSSRLIIGALNVAPDLPTKASLSEITDLRVSLALDIDNARTRLGLLPTSAAFMERQVSGMLTNMEQDHIRYLDALFNSEAVETSATIESMLKTQGEIEQALRAHLDTLRPMANEQLDRLEALLGQLQP